MDQPSEAELQHTEQMMRADFEHSLPSRIARRVATRGPQIIPGWPFADVRREAISLYVDGHFVGCLMATYGLSDAYAPWISDCNKFSWPTKLNDNGHHERVSKPELMAAMRDAGVISEDVVNAWLRLHKRFRNNVTHLSMTIDDIESKAGKTIDQLAALNLADLKKIDSELLAFREVGNAIAPVNPQYWTEGETGSQYLVNVDFT